MDSVTYKVGLMQTEMENTSHSCESPVATTYDLGLPYISQTSGSQCANVLRATLHGCLALHLPTIVHRHTALL